MAVEIEKATEPKDALTVAVGLRVALLRKERGDIQPAEFAERVGISAAYLWRIEAGRQNLSLRNLARIAKAFDITLSQLLDGVETSSIVLQNRPYAKRDGDGPG